MDGNTNSLIKTQTSPTFHVLLLSPHDADPQSTEAQSSNDSKWQIHPFCPVFWGSFALPTGLVFSHIFPSSPSARESRAALPLLQHRTVSPLRGSRGSRGSRGKRVRKQGGKKDQPQYKLSIHPSKLLTDLFILILIITMWWRRLRREADLRFLFFFLFFGTKIWEFWISRWRNVEEHRSICRSVQFPEIAAVLLGDSRSMYCS